LLAGIQSSEVSRQKEQLLQHHGGQELDGVDKHEEEEGRKGPVAAFLVSPRTGGALRRQPGKAEEEDGAALASSSTRVGRHEKENPRFKSKCLTLRQETFSIAMAGIKRGTSH